MPIWREIVTNDGAELPAAAGLDECDFDGATLCMI
jgi:hypothetical protein